MLSVCFNGWSIDVFPLFNCTIREHHFDHGLAIRIIWRLMLTLIAKIIHLSGCLSIWQYCLGWWLGYVFGHQRVVTITSTLNVVSTMLHSVRHLNFHSFSESHFPDLVLKFILIPYIIHTIAKIIEIWSFNKTKVLLSFSLLPLCIWS